MNAAISEFDQYLFHEGTHTHSYQFMGAHCVEVDGKRGVRFTIWAPNARSVSVVGDFNEWRAGRHHMERVSQNGLWSLFIPGLQERALYRYAVTSGQGRTILKADPYAFRSEVRPKTASVVCDLGKYKWQDGAWMKRRRETQTYDKPVNIYEVHLGSWKRREDNSFYSYRELADELVDYAAEMGYTHIELLPVMEHPHDGSWGYQITGYYAATSRYGSPEDLMYFIDRCHQRGLGVILDWVPGHFCRDQHGLAHFDGQACYEYPDPDRGFSPQWGTANFDHGRPEVRSFLISNAIFWFDLYHADGLRVDAVSNILYLRSGEHHQAGIDFIRQLNKSVFSEFPGAIMAAEESTAWPLVTSPVHLGGLGFNYKWNMGWMNDVLRYMAQDPLFRKGCHNLLTFSLMYAYSENFILPLSHDEVVHGKKSLLDKMPGDYWQKFANLRALLGYMATHPGKKLLFMGSEFGQFAEWRDDSGLDWLLLDYEMHAKLKQYTHDLNWLYRNETALWQLDYRPQGFKWIEPDDASQSVISFIRCPLDRRDHLVVVCNFTPVVRHNFRIGVPSPRVYREVFNSDSAKYGGSGVVNPEPISADFQALHNQAFSLELTLPPLAVVVLKPQA